MMNPLEIPHGHDLLHELTLLLYVRATGRGLPSGDSWEYRRNPAVTSVASLVESAVDGGTAQLMMNKNGWSWLMANKLVNNG